MPSTTQWAAARTRGALYAAIREFFSTLGFLEVETPILVPAAGMEPHIEPFVTQFEPQTDVGRRRSLYLHTSPEYAMKRLLADGSPGLFQICKTFRNGEISGTHNPEFTMLEFYRPHADYTQLMNDVEALFARVEAQVSQTRWFAQTPWERLTVRDAVKRHTGIDLYEHLEGASLRRAAQAIGVHVGDSTSFDDVFFHLFLERVERQLGHERPTFLIEYPASMAALSRLKPGDSRVAERVELYVRGLELGNGFSELTNAAEQRARLAEEQAFRRREGRLEIPLDEPFLEAVGRMPECAGIAIGLDRILMLLTNASELSEVLLFPAREFA